MRCTYIFICVVGFFSCNREEIKYDYKEYSIDNNLIINLDEQTDFNFYYTQVLEENGDFYLLSLNNLGKSLDKIDLANGSIVTKIKFPDDSPVQIDYVQGFTFVNEDSIFLFRRGQLNGMQLINSQSKFIKGYRPEKIRSNDRNDLNNHVSIPKAPTYYSAGQLDFIRYPLYDTTNPINNNKHFIFQLKYDLVKDTIVYDSIAVFPELYWGKSWPSQNLGLSRIKGHFDNLMIYSWDLSDSVIIKNTLTGQINKKSVRSKYHKENVSMKIGIDINQQFNHYVNSSIYYSIHYDKYKRLYYRVFRIPYGKDLGKIPLYSYPSDINDFSIIVLNEDFEILREVVFPGKIYKPEQSFVTNKGLFIPKINSFSDAIHEDYIEYEIYRF